MIRFLKRAKAFMDRGNNALYVSVPLYILWSIYCYAFLL